MLLANSAIDKATHMMKMTLSSQPQVLAAGPAVQRFSQNLYTQSMVVCSRVTVADTIPHCRGNTRKQTHDREADGKRRPGREFTLELLLVAQGCQRRLVLGHLIDVIRLVARRQRGGHRRRMVRFRHGFGKASRLGSIYSVRFDKNIRGRTTQRSRISSNKHSDDNNKHTRRRAE